MASNSSGRFSTSISRLRVTAIHADIVLVPRLDPPFSSSPTPDNQVIWGYMRRRRSGYISDVHKGGIERFVNLKSLDLVLQVTHLRTSKGGKPE